MRRFLELTRRFRDDERGAFLVIFGLLAIVLIATSGAVVDFVSVQQARTRAQVALDAAALALQSQIYTKNEEFLRSKAEALVVERVGDAALNVAVTSAVKDTNEGSLTLSGHLSVPTMFVSLVGVRNIDASILSEATRKKNHLEVVMVLDNSNSMKDYSRMTNLIAATKCATNILLNENCNSTATAASVDNVKIGIVPFTLQVNVGASNANAAWLDRTSTPLPKATRDNFDNDNFDGNSFVGAVDRIALFGKLRWNNADLTWGGCVEARKPPYDTTDDPAVSGTDTMFTPMFAPDEPDTGFSNSYIADTPVGCPVAPTWKLTSVKSTCTAAATTKSQFNSLSCTGGTSNTYAQTNENGATVTAATTQPTALYNNPASCTENYTNSSTGSGSSKRYTNTQVINCTYSFSNRELQERLCKYSNASLAKATLLSQPVQGNVYGPNGDCPTNAILPLTSTKSNVVAAINKLAPQGGTNIHAGTEWGFRVLSPTAPFTEGSAYALDVSKVLIVMTDGENTAYQTGNMNNTTYYSYYGYPYNQRLGTTSSTDAQLETEMNTRTVTTCNNAKAQGITIYTIGLSVDDTSNPTANRKMLRDCSSGDGFYYFPAKASDLTSVFTTIASQLSALRLAR